MQQIVSRPRGAVRWGQLVLGILCMVMIANLQYGWTLFVPQIDARFHWGKPAIQTAFTIFILMETWLLPIEGYLIDRLGPRPAVALGGLLIGAGWVMNGFATTLPLLYAAAAVGGVGAGLIYGTTVGNAVKWFPDRRGLASGLTAAGFGAGSALTIVPIANWIAAHGYQSAFVVFGIGQGVCVLLLATLLRRPPARPVTTAASVGGGATDMAPRAVLRTSSFWLMYLMFVLVGAGGLMATAQLAVIAHDFGVADTRVTLLAVTMPALTFALSLDRIMNGITRPFFGWVSDRVGRENTMFAAFLLEGVAIFAMLGFAHHPVAFVVLSGLVFFAWGEIYSLFPATCSDLYGARYATTNYGMMYTAKGTAALLVPLSAMLQASAGWASVFCLAAACNVLAALLALFALKPLRLRHIKAEAAPAMLSPGQALPHAG
jgi:OFA family oxalate/formate antiporter-like MFS transporter